MSPVGGCTRGAHQAATKLGLEVAAAPQQPQWVLGWEPHEHLIPAPLHPSLLSCLDSGLVCLHEKGMCLLPRSRPRAGAGDWMND